MSEKGIWTVSGPSGVGKTTLVGNLLKHISHVSPLVRVTIRSPRQNLAKNIQEATELCLEGEDPADFGLSPSPTVLINFELFRIPEHVQA